jgi:hypothetical protein
MAVVGAELRHFRRDAAPTRRREERTKAEVFHTNVVMDLKNGSGPSRIRDVSCKVSTSREIGLDDQIVSRGVLTVPL